MATAAVLLAQANYFLEDLYIEAFALGFKEDFFVRLIQGLDLFLNLLDAFDD